jgi:predicted nucleic acid-binding protein
MPVAFDANFLVPLLDAKAKVDPAIRAKMFYLVNRLHKAGDKIVVPTPALAEFLIKADDAAPAYLEALNRSKYFRVVSFDQRAAVEVAAAHREALGTGDKREGTASPWTKVKYDRQIVAIAKVEGVTAIFSDDPHIATYAKRDGIPVTTLADLPEPPTDAQAELPLLPPTDKEGQDGTGG